MSVRALQQQRALHLYRRSLKTILYWAVRRDLWFSEVILRQEGITFLLMMCQLLQIRRARD